MTKHNYPNFNVAQMEFLCKDLQSLIGANVKDIYAQNPSQLIILFYNKTQENKLLLSFQKPFLRFHFVNKLKFSHDFYHPLKKFLIDATLTSIKVINHDRILQMGFKHGGKLFYLIGEFIPRHPNLFLLDEKKNILFSIAPAKQQNYSFPPPPPVHQQDNLPILTHDELENIFSQLDDKLHFENDKGALKTQLQHQLKRSLKRQSQIQVELKECLEWENIQHTGDLLKANFSSLKRGIEKILVWDWQIEQEIEIFLNPALSPQEQVKEFFKRSKKLHKSLTNIERQSEKISQSIQSINHVLMILESIQTAIELEDLKKNWSTPAKSTLIPQQKPKISRALPYYDFESASGMKIWVGKSAKDNDVLTFNLANGSDWWLHVKDFSGSHVIIKTKKEQEPDHETLQDAMQLALQNSQAKDLSEAEICVTQRKFVSRSGKGRIGKVNISKHKTLLAKKDSKRMQELKVRRERKL
ncbi:MAG: DUF814 domain-containing protein [Parachlamydiaceae bacterium]|nr:DUF814 domain-containing protein [Parachlamydiaceae bacterium]